jgi:hypothetical protein
MKVSLRAATHLDFTEFAPTPPSSRYGAIVTSYYTLAWFDRYLRGAPAARLTADRFDDSADIHYISGGTFDPATGANVPARIAGQPVTNRLSFHFRSAWSFARGSARCEDVRAGCAPVADVGAPTARACSRPRFTPRVARVHRGRVRLRPRVVCGGRARSVVVELRATRRLVRAVTGRPVTLRVARTRRNAAVTFSVGGTRHRVKVRLRRR